MIPNAEERLMNSWHFMLEADPMDYYVVWADDPYGFMTSGEIDGIGYPSPLDTGRPTHWPKECSCLNYDRDCRLHLGHK